MAVLLYNQSRLSALAAVHIITSFMYIRKESFKYSPPETRHSRLDRYYFLETFWFWGVFNTIKVFWTCSLRKQNLGILRSPQNNRQDDAPFETSIFGRGAGRGKKLCLYDQEAPSFILQFRMPRQLSRAMEYLLWGILADGAFHS